MQNPYFFYDNPLMVNEPEKCKIEIAKINAEIEEGKASVEKLAQYVNQLDEEVKAEVINVLNTMVSDGTLASVMSQVLDDRQETIYCRRDHRQIYVTGKHNYHYSASGANFAYWLNSACSFYHNNTHYIVGLFPHHNASTNEVEVRLYNYDLTLVRQATLILGQARSVTYYNGYLYVAESNRQVSGATASSHYLHKINVDTLVNEQTYTLDIVARAVYSHNGELYVTDAVNIYTYDTDNLVLTQVYTIPSYWQRYGQGGLGFKNMFFDSNFYYLIFTNPNVIVRVNRNTNAVNYIYNFPVVSPDNYHLGEVMSCTYNENSGVLDIFTAIDLQTTNYAQQSVFNHFEANLLHNIYPNLFVQPITPSKYSQLIVDHTTTVLNPDGSGNRPFATLQEAINYACANELFTNYTIVLRDTSGYGYFTTIDTNKTIRIQGTGTEHTTIGGIYAWGGQIYLYNLTCGCTLADGDSDNNACISLRNAKASLQNCAMYTSTGASEYFRSTDYGVNCYASDVIIDNVTGQSGHNIIAWANCSRVTEATSGSITAS